MICPGISGPFAARAGARSRLPSAWVLTGECVVISESITSFPGARSRIPRLQTGAPCATLSFELRFSSAAPILVNHVFKTSFDAFCIKPGWER